MNLFTDWIENCESFAAAECIGESAAIVSWERTYVVLETFLYEKNLSIKNFFRNCMVLPIGQDFFFEKALKTADSFFFAEL